MSERESDVKEMGTFENSLAHFVGQRKGEFEFVRDFFVPWVVEETKRNLANLTLVRDNLAILSSQNLHFKPEKKYGLNATLNLIKTQKLIHAHTVEFVGECRDGLIYRQNDRVRSAQEKFVMNLNAASISEPSSVSEAWFIRWKFATSAFILIDNRTQGPGMGFTKRWSKRLLLMGNSESQKLGECGTLISNLRYTKGRETLINWLYSYIGDT